MSHVVCHMSHVTCHVSPVTCYLSSVMCHHFFLSDQIAELDGGGSVINRANPVQFDSISLITYSTSKLIQQVLCSLNSWCSKGPKNALHWTTSDCLNAKNFTWSGVQLTLYLTAVSCILGWFFQSALLEISFELYFFSLSWPY